MRIPPWLEYNHSPVSSSPAKPSFLRQAPGLLAAAALAAAALPAADALSRRFPVSGILLALVGGMILSNTVLRGPLRAALSPGLELAAKKALRLGIVLVGLKLSLRELWALGAAGIPLVLLLVAGAIALTLLLSRRLGVPDRMGILAAASTSICGVTAAAAVAPAIEADEKEVAYTVANVTLFGSLATVLYPPLAHALLGASPASAGFFLGGSIHDTSQVMAAAFTYGDLYRDEAAVKAATLVKLARASCLLGVVPLLALLHARRAGTAGKKVPLKKLFPVFVIGFLAMAALRTAGDATAGSGTALGFLAPERWSAAVKWAGGSAAQALLATALAGVGLSTDFRKLRELGLRPFCVGALAAALVGAIALGLAALFGKIST